MPETKPKCAECGVEIEGDPEVCAKCGFDLHGFRSFFRIFKAAAKRVSDEDAEQQAKDALEKKKSKPSVMDSILGKKKKV
jgi:ribosomal protein L34E